MKHYVLVFDGEIFDDQWMTETDMVKMEGKSSGTTDVEGVWEEHEERHDEMTWVHKTGRKL